jgi:hypothetical protein
MASVAHGILSGRILLGDRWRVVDGLRAWSAVLLMFALEAPARSPLLQLRATRAEVLQLAVRLFELQEHRNQVAHRHLVRSYPAIEHVRAEAFRVFELVARAFPPDLVPLDDEGAA